MAGAHRSASCAIVAAISTMKPITRRRRVLSPNRFASRAPMSVPATSPTTTARPDRIAGRPRGRRGGFRVRRAANEEAQAEQENGKHDQPAPRADPEQPRGEAAGQSGREATEHIIGVQQLSSSLLGPVGLRVLDTPPRRAQVS